VKLNEGFSEIENHWLYIYILEYVRILRGGSLQVVLVCDTMC